MYNQSDIHDSPTILIAGDFVSTERIEKVLGRKDFETSFGEIKEIVQRADFAIVNLESPVVRERANAIDKIGPHLKSTPILIDAIKYIGFNAVTLANNHFYDYGEEGAISTLSLLKDAGIKYVGAGENIDKAREVLYFHVKNKTIAIINCCEHEYSIATEARAGSNPLDPIGQYYNIMKARRKADVVIVIIHGGVEMYKYPTPRMVSTYRFFIDAGADAVLNHHQHCCSGYETYKNKPIFYGLGNFCFDKKGKQGSEWNYGYMVNMTFQEDSVDFKLYPYSQCDTAPVVVPIYQDSRTWFDKQLQEINYVINSPDLLGKEYDMLLCRSDNQYKLSIYSNRFLNALCKRGLLPSLISKRVLRRIQHNVLCESHYERFLHSINQKLL